MFSTVFDFDIILSYLLTFRGLLQVTTALGVESFMQIMSVGCLPLGGEQVQCWESWGERAINYPVLTVFSWTLRLGIFTHVIRNYVILTTTLKVGFPYLMINSLSDTQKCCDWL